MRYEFMLRPAALTGIGYETYDILNGTTQKWSKLMAPFTVIAFLFALLTNPVEALAATGNQYGSGAGGLLGSDGKLKVVNLAIGTDAGTRFVIILERIVTFVMVCGVVGVIIALIGAGYKAAVQQDNREAQSILVRALLGSIFVIAAYALANYLQYSFGE